MDGLVQVVGRLLSELHAAFPARVCPGDWAWATTMAGGLLAVLPMAGAVLVALIRKWTGNRYSVALLLAFAAVGLALTAALPWLGFHGASEVFRGALDGQAGAVGLRRADLVTMTADFCFAPPQVEYLGGAHTVVEVLGSLSNSQRAVLAGGLLLLVVPPLLAMLFVFAQSRLAFRRGPAWPARLLWLPMLLLMLGTASLSATVVAHLWLGFLPATMLGMIVVALIGPPRWSVINRSGAGTSPPAALAPDSSRGRTAGAPAGAGGTGAVSGVPPYRPPTGGFGPTSQFGSSGPLPARGGGPRSSWPAGHAGGGFPRSPAPAAGGVPRTSGPDAGGVPRTSGPAAGGVPRTSGPDAGGVPRRPAPDAGGVRRTSGPDAGGAARRSGAAAAGPQRPSAPQPAPGPTAHSGQRPRPTAHSEPQRPTSTAPLGLPDQSGAAEPPQRQPARALSTEPGPIPQTLQRALGLEAAAEPPQRAEQPTLPASRFQRIRPLGSGGFGTVWLAMDTALDRTVAVKAAKAPDAETERRIQREARALAAVHHPNCVRIYDLLTDTGGELVLVMEYVPGRSLSAEIEADGPLPDKAAAQLWSTLAGALHAAHAKGVLHRDVKPSNIIIDGVGQPHLIDFGIARATGDVTITVAGMVLGTPDYMAPEVAAGQPASPAADAWQLAATVSFALAARPPRGHPDGSMAAMLAAAQGEPCNQLPPRTALRGLLERALHPDPARRPDLPTVQAELDRWLAATTHDPVTELLPPAWPTEDQP